MNAQKKAAFLKEKGYSYNRKAFMLSGEKSHQWFLGFYMVSRYASFAQATNEAYQHYLDNQDATEAQQTAPVQEAESEAPKRGYGQVNKNGASVEMDIDYGDGLATPKYSVGQFVKLNAEYEGEWIGKIVSIRRIEEESVTYGLEIAGWPDQPFEEDEIDFATDDSPVVSSLVSVPSFIAERDAELEALRQEVAELQKKLDSKARSLLDKCEDSAQLRKGVQSVIDRLGKDIDENMSVSAPKIVYYRAELKKAISQAPKEAPDVASEATKQAKFMVDDKVILAGERDKGVRTINSVHPTPSGEYLYRVVLPSGKFSDTYWYESELELEYRPSWNKQQA